MNCISGLLASEHRETAAKIKLQSLGVKTQGWRMSAKTKSKAILDVV